MSFDEAYFWKTNLRSYLPTTYLRPNMILPKINTLTGKYYPEKTSIHDEMNHRYSLYSEAYWAGVKKRQANRLS